ncbi:serine/threonine-protein kinase [Pseudoxanthomonas kalamensis]|uniref:serine/threonine-protein kinase n=1 Tax=Pseudoxanthomonas kalamensis TaxID=289483 RepID=UPI001390CEA2|nr:serine/threonine-protein kinase [Pseudoxanthomonas kalamensis]
MPSLAASAGETAALSGRQLGRWLLTDLLGKGGMSVVYRARSLQPPAGQRAAVKLLSLAAATDEGKARFAREIDILVRLSHPGIAPVLDAGVAEDGTPWFAMALVEGIDIETWCREQGLDTAQRVELFLQVCDAVEYAHRHLVIHRDIKPSNVLVDHEGRVVLLDFGISRMLEEGASELTGTGIYALTPRYAAPEQLHGGAITTATDVYGLGSLLHQLLVGKPPQFPEDVADAECRDPAVLLDRENDRARRRLLVGDLGAILKKALAREPVRRYPGAAELGADLRAWQAGRPVAAHHDSGWYRFGKFIARHRLAASLTTALLLALVGGIWMSLVQRAAALAAVEQATTAEASAQRQLKFLQELLLSLSPSRNMPTNIPRKQLLAHAESEAHRQLADDPSTLADVLVSLATIHSQAGRNKEAVALLEEANRLAPPTAGDIDSLLREARLIAARLVLKPRTDWAAEIKRLAEIENAVSHARPGSGDHLSMVSWLTSALIGASRYDEAEAANARAWALCPGAGKRFCTAIAVRESDILWNAGKTAASVAKKDELWRQPDLEQSLSADEYDTFLMRYALALEGFGRFDDALALTDRILERHARFYAGPTVTSINALNVRALSQYQLNRLDEALATIDRGIADAVSIEGKASVRAVNLGEVRIRILLRMGRKDEANAAVEDLLPRMRAIYGNDNARVLTLTRHKVAHLADTGQLPEAIALMRDLVARMRKSKPAGSRQLAQLQIALARLLMRSGDPRAADAQYLAARPAYLDANGKDTAESLVLDAERGVAMAQLGRPEEASAMVLGALSALRKDHRDTSNYVTVLIKAISGKCKGPDREVCEALRAEGWEVIARDVPAQRRLFGKLREAIGT